MNRTSFVADDRTFVNRVTDRQEPHRLSILSFLSLPGVGDSFRRVPPKFYRRHSDHITIDCPCDGGEVKIPLVTPTPCEGCGRSYVATRRGLFAAQGMTEVEWQAFQAEPLAVEP